MVKSDDFIMNRMLWKAKQYGIPSLWTFIFDDLSPTYKENVLAFTDREAIGKPVLYFTKPTLEWTLLCTRQVICYDKQQVVVVNISDIKQFDSPLFDPGPDVPKQKQELDTLRVIDKDDKVHVLHAAKGKDLFGLWNVLRMVRSFNDNNANDFVDKQ